ncbi:MAG: prephenate dehydratase [Clostridiales bacterium]|nr:prephenate dehydratase [Clostridiales bacterium]
MQRVAYLGIPGSFSYQATRIYFGDEVDPLSQNSFDDIFKLLDSGDGDFGVLPVENSSVGMITQVFDLLNQYNAKIQGELFLRVEHNLLTISGARLEDIKEIYSHPQAIQQCAKFLGQSQNWQAIPFFDTAKSAKWVKGQKDKALAAIGSTEAARLYGLDILVSDIQDNSSNYTRFVIIARENEIKADYNKISLNLTLNHTAGSLYKVVEQFAKSNLNMLSIKSRPIVSRPFEYMFYIDFEGNLRDDNVKYALKRIQRHCSNFKILGNYKAGTFKHIL